MHCLVEILDDPIIETVPLSQVSKDIFCTTVACAITLQKAVSVLTTHNAETSLAIETGIKPFWH
ncbi:hypothetical protein BGZ81_006249, partial [Podila clonocystis]